MVTTSGCHAMWLVLETLLDDGDEVIIEKFLINFLLG